MEELLPLTDVAHVSDARGLLGEGLPYGAASWSWTRSCAASATCVPFIVAEINEPDPCARWT